MSDRVLLLLPTTSYKTTDFMEAASRLGLAVVIGTDRRQALERAAPGHTLAIDFREPTRAVDRIVAEGPFRAVVGVDDETVDVAALAASRLGLDHNPLEAVRTSRDKAASRRAFATAGLASPVAHRFAVDAGAGGAVAAARDTVGYPCVLKPLSLSASRGVIRCDDERTLRAAFDRLVALLARPEVRERSGDHDHLLLESYLPGHECSVEGLLVDDELRTLALFDKPESMEGPTFEETLFVRPSRMPRAERHAVNDAVRRGCAALGLRTGPIHAEVRVHGGAATLLEVAARTIGGLCSRALRFGTGRSLEEVVLAHAVGRPFEPDVSEEASGVAMLAVPRRGTLRAIEGLDEARAVEHIEQVEMSVHRGDELEPLPEGNRYMGFLFARAPTSDRVETALKAARGRIRFEWSD